jgi:predicted acylesterase/phospholipase RssA
MEAWPGLVSRSHHGRSGVLPNGIELRHFWNCGKPPNLVSMGAAMRDFQICFQGGGARLADLLAVVEVLQEEEAAGRIRVRRVAGTSAGAIAAAVLAFGGRSAKVVRAYLRSNGARLVRAVSGSDNGEINLASMSSLWKIYQGSSVLKVGGFRASLYEVLNVAQQEGIRATSHPAEQIQQKRLGLSIADIEWLSNKKLVIIAADLVSRETVEYPKSGDNLVEALIDSCAIPFAFRGHGELGAKPYVDGGLCTNLPSDVLLSGVQEFGQILAVSFTPKKPPSTPEGLKDYISALIGTAVSGSVAGSISRLPHDVEPLRIESRLSTLEFAKAFSGANEDQEIRTIRDAEQWIKDHLRRPPPPPPAAAILEEVMANVYEWYRMLHSDEHQRKLKSAVIVTANCLKTKNPREADSDNVIKEYRFAPLGKPMSMFYMLVGRSLPAVLPRIEVTSPGGGKVRHRVIPALDRHHGREGQSVDLRGYILLFDDPLYPLNEDQTAAGDYYRARMIYSEWGGLTGLLTDRRADYIRFHSPHAGIHERVEIVVRYPKAFHFRAYASWKDLESGGSSGTGNELTEEELSPYDLMDPAMTIVGWQVLNLPPKREFRVDFHGQ